jgi:hypothetical protein
MTSLNNIFLETRIIQYISHLTYNNSYAKREKKTLIRYEYYFLLTKEIKIRDYSVVEYIEIFSFSDDQVRMYQ